MSLLAYVPVVSHPTSTGPTTTVTQVVWPPNALPIFLTLVMLAVLVIGYWRHMRPCDTCGEYQPQCRCKARSY